ncbi:uncharacterized protein TRIADDRAFT_58703 [Trichoplax adhaerens]|uniref:F-box domain-containing protein n=1 Tax=Trichoplax adhaerens TaxID=10228 RepID=B3S3F8_TRIAD|nr:hypothetical protein TRIADDRAFT_58703 [Trichoplax adhaerens]EDV22785.1 hypothetical protein TRIADDRAFT_58703 [Trichoplax adhaerens]|eukprot:XP_002114651.1 hypothetical protein TRIADDRAFT_58703 [Trichoplax adhaerens]
MFNCPKCANGPQFDSLLGLKYHLESYHPHGYPSSPQYGQVIPSSQYTPPNNHSLQQTSPSNLLSLFPNSPTYYSNDTINGNKFATKDSVQQHHDTAMYTSPYRRHQGDDIANASNLTPTSLPTSKQIHSLQGFYPLHFASSPFLASKISTNHASSRSDFSYRQFTPLDDHQYKLSNVLDKSMQSKQELLQLQKVLDQRNYQLVEMKAELKLAKLEKNRLESERSYMKAEIDANEAVINKLEHKLSRREREFQELERKTTFRNDVAQGRIVPESTYRYSASPSVGGPMQQTFQRQSRRSSIRSYKHDDIQVSSNSGGNNEVATRKISHDQGYAPLDELVHAAMTSRRQSSASKQYQSDGDSSRRKTPTSDEQAHPNQLTMSLPSSNYEINQLNDDQSTGSLIMSEVMLRRNMSAGSKSEFDGYIASPHGTLSLPIEDIDDLPCELDPQAEVNLASRTGSTSEHVSLRLSRHNSNTGKSPRDSYLPRNIHRTPSKASSIYRHESNRSNRSQRVSFSKTFSTSPSLQRQIFHGDTIGKLLGRFGQDQVTSSFVAIFSYLGIKDKLKVSEVCRFWWTVSRHPSLWSKIHLRKTRVSFEAFVAMSNWATQLETLTVEDIKPRRRLVDEEENDYKKAMTGSLEKGLSKLLKASRGNIISIKIINCGHLVTSKDLLWTFGSTCKDIIDLAILPHPSSANAEQFNNSCLHVIGKSWLQLSSLKIGSPTISDRGLIAIAVECKKLKHLRLDRSMELSSEVAEQMCNFGLKSIEQIEFTNTPISHEAIRHFAEKCGKIKAILIQLSIEDFFEDIHESVFIEEYNNIIDNLLVMKREFIDSKQIIIKAEKVPLLTPYQ